jgi:hypothetical protein
LSPLGVPRDDVEQEKYRSQYYIRRLVEAISTPYTDRNSPKSKDKNHEQRLTQQAKINKKPYDSAQYTSKLVNSRLQLLYHTAVSYHSGGRVYYDIGGDNSGYGEDKSLIFSERLNKLIELLTTNKDIAMDIIEGRGVTAVVQNPGKYERRKRDNKKSNDTKQVLQEKGKRVEEREATMDRAGTSVLPDERAGAYESIEMQDTADMGTQMPFGGQRVALQQQADEFEGYVPAWKQ